MLLGWLGRRARLRGDAPGRRPRLTPSPALALQGGQFRPGLRQPARVRVGHAARVGGVALEQAQALPGRGLGEHLVPGRQRLRQRLDESAFLFDVSLAALAESDFRQAGLTLVNKLAARFGCHQVQLALADGTSLKTRAVSFSAWFDERANLTALARAAMTEAYDQRHAVAWPAGVAEHHPDQRDDPDDVQGPVTLR